MNVGSLPKKRPVGAAQVRPASIEAEIRFDRKLPVLLVLRGVTSGLKRNGPR